MVFLGLFHPILIGVIWVFPELVVPPKHPKVIIFSRKTPWLLGKPTILGNPHIYNPRVTNWWRLGGKLPWSYVVALTLQPPGTESVHRISNEVLQPPAPSTCPAPSRFSHHLRSDQFTLVIYLLYRGDEILPSYMGMVISHYKDPSYTTSIMQCQPGFFFTLLIWEVVQVQVFIGIIPYRHPFIFSNNDLGMFHHLRKDGLWKSWFCRGFEWWDSFHPDFVWCLRGTYSKNPVVVPWCTTIDNMDYLS